VSVELKFEIRPGDLSGVEADLGVVLAFKEQGPAGPVGAAVAARLSEIMRGDRFEGRSGAHLLWHAPAAESFSCRRYLVVGLGRREEFTLERYRRYLGDALVSADRVGAERVALTLPDDSVGPIAPRDAALALAEGAILGTYRYDKYRSEPRSGRRHLRQITVATGQAPAADVKAGIDLGRITSDATNFARDLVNEPAGTLTPEVMAGIVRDSCRDSGLSVRVFEPDEMRRMGMGGIIGVGQGSENPPRMIQIEYTPDSKPSRRVALVGKGLTFDSGGLSIKTSEGMETMKCDMAGSAAVFATLRALPKVAPRVQVMGLMGMAENMPSGRAIRPGDVLKIMNGKTVEVRNTDAEGRLVLADVLSYASTFKDLQETVDLATLTGAVVVALGPMAAGVTGNDRAFVDELVRAAGRAGEAVWPMPLYGEYAEHIRSDIADLKNTGIRYGGAITAALFLKEFVRRGLRWAHMDIAGPAFGDKEYSYIKRGGTGFGVRTLIRYLQDASA